MTVTHPLRGPSRVVVERNGRTIVANGRRGGYVQRAYFSRGGRSYVQRTYVVNNVSYTSVYRTSYYGGVAYYGYVPGYYYAPAYYGWAYNPWVAPVYYTPAVWGWAGAPWYAYYGFNPYPVYPSAAFWLTDYLIAANLQAAYAAQAEAANAATAQAYAAGQQAQAQADANAEAANAPPPPAPDAGQAAPASTGQVQLSDAVKQQIAEEVKAQLAAEQAAAGTTAQPAATSAEVPDALNPKEPTFVVASTLDVNAGGQECSLTSGDVITRTGTTPDNNQDVPAIVSGSKGSDCAVGAQVAVSVEDLQEMHNHFRQQLDDGLKKLASNSGKNGLPNAPDTSTKPGEAGPPPAADSSAAAQLASAQQEGQQTEQAVQQSDSGAGAGAGSGH